MKMRKTVLASMLLLLAGWNIRLSRPVFAAGASQLDSQVESGRKLIRQFDCGSCHLIPGVQGAEGTVGPPLILFAKRGFIAGEVPNTRENLVQWLMSPQSIEKGTAMPQLGLTDAQARDVAAYLYTLRSKNWYGGSK